jgi:deoxyribodipyrimidine photolyase
MKKRHRPAARFCQQKAADYEQQRDLPAMEGTSRLSPAWPWALSPRQCLHRLLASSRGAGWRSRRYGLTSLSGASFTAI